MQLFVQVGHTSEDGELFENMFTDNYSLMFMTVALVD